MSTQDERTLKAVERLMKVAPAGRVNRLATNLRRKLASDMMAVPMSKILAQVEGLSAAGKARTLGITRQAVHQWLNGICRPNEQQAKKLAKLTSFSVDAIRGRDAA